MTVYAHIKTTRVNYGSDNVTFNNKDGIDVWLVTVPQSLSEKTSSEIKQILGITSHGIWITFPYKNCFWVITYLPNEFDVQEFKSADLEDIYTKHDIDVALAKKANASHTHSSNEITDLDETIEEHMDVMADDINNFFDTLTQALLE